jgi:phosphoglycolate phosphatase
VIPQPDAVLFDLDGVIADSRVPYTRSVNAALERNGVAPWPPEDLHRFIGPPLHATFLELTGDPMLVQPCVDAYRERYRAHAVAETPVMPGMADALATIAARVPIAVATSKPLAMAAPLLEGMGLASLFTRIEGPSLEDEHEPKAETVRRALAAVGDVHSAVMVGDRLYDVMGATANGLPCIGVLWGIGSEAELREAGAQELAPDAAELLRILGMA